MNKKVKKAAAKFYRQLKGNVLFETVENYLKRIGYKVIFFNTPQGDAEIARYHLSETIYQAKAFTYCSTAKIIFIDNNLSAEDKFYALLHEVAHIILKHLEIERLSTHSSIRLDIDADAFVHYLLNPQQSPSKTIATCTFLAIAIISAFFYNPAMNTNSTSVSNIITQSSDIVYITSTGQHFHFANCGTITGRATAQIKRDEALKIHTPCKMCNP